MCWSFRRKFCSCCCGCCCCRCQSCCSISKYLQPNKFNDFVGRKFTMQAILTKIKKLTQFMQIKFRWIFGIQRAVWRLSRNMNDHMCIQTSIFTFRLRRLIEFYSNHVDNLNLNRFIPIFIDEMWMFCFFGKLNCIEKFEFKWLISWHGINFKKRRYKFFIPISFDKRPL